MKKIPSAMIIVDPRQEETAIKEARKLKIPVFGIVDTNCDPDMVDFVIPANDDAVRSVKLVIGVLANAIAEVNGKELNNYIAPEDAKKEEKKEKPAKIEKEETKVVVEETKEEIKKEEPKKAPVKKETKKETKNVSLDDKTLTELKALAKDKNVKGYSTMKKAELIDALK